MSHVPAAGSPLQSRTRIGALRCQRELHFSVSVEIFNPRVMESSQGPLGEIRTPLNLARIEGEAAPHDRQSSDPGLPELICRHARHHRGEVPSLRESHRARRTQVRTACGAVSLTRRGICASSRVSESVPTATRERWFLRLRGPLRASRPRSSAIPTCHADSRRR